MPMKERKHILFVAWLLLAAASCTRPVPDEDRRGVVDIHALVDASVSKSPVTGNNFPNWSGREDTPEGTFGIFCCEHEDSPALYRPHKNSNYNVRAYRSGSTLRYHYVSMMGSEGALDNEYSNRFILSQRKDNKTADIYAYAPWSRGAWASGPTAIPFQTRNQYDWMYAQENGSDNLDLDPLGTDLKATFHFRHAMALLRFEFRLLNTPTNYTIYLESVTRSSGAPLYESGTFNAVTGTLDNLVETDKLEIHPAVSVNSTTPSSISLMLVPGVLSDTDSLTFHFIANPISTNLATGQELVPFVLTKSLLEHSAVPGTYGLLPGYVYTYRFTLDNYVFFDGFTVDTQWKTPATPSEDLNPIHI